ncbi:MAG: TIGR02266 family protein [Deltaproteobacteria bacterium]|nr:TIGR02266 family protein [Deltaproteobacteria bacterium]
MFYDSLEFGIRNIQEEWLVHQRQEFLVIGDKKMVTHSFFNIAREETYQDGQVIFEQGSSGTWVYVILSGAIEVSRTVRGRKYILSILREGEVFGELALIGSVKRTATTRAIGETTVGILDREFLDGEFNKLSSDFRSILVTFVRRFEKMIDRIQEFSIRGRARISKSLSLSFKDRDTFISAYSGNISSGGVFIVTKNPLKVGEEFLLKLQLPDLKAPLQIRCRVSWTRQQEEATKERPPGMGVKFVEMSQSDTKILKEYISQT